MSPKTSSLATVALLAVGCIGIDHRGEPWNTVPFSAEIVDLQRPAKPARMVYVGEGKLRFEDRDPVSPSALVFDPAGGQILFINDKDRAYLDAGMLAPVVSAGFAPLFHLFHPTTGGDPCAVLNATVDGLAAFTRQRNSGPPPHLTCRSLGAESVNGRPAQKWAVTDGQNPGTIWIDDRLHIIAKSVDRNSGTELRNVREGQQPTSLFAPPPGYRRLGLREMLNAASKMSGTTTASGRGAGDSLSTALDKLRGALGKP